MSYQQISILIKKNFSSKDYKMINLFLLVLRIFSAIMTFLLYAAMYAIKYATYQLCHLWKYVNINETTLYIYALYSDVPHDITLGMFSV